MRTFWRRARAFASMWTRHPGLSDATRLQPVFAIASSFHWARRAATPGHSKLKVPPNPQHLAMSGISTTS